MKYDSVQSLSDEAFKRSTGVQRSTFMKMLEVVGHGLRNFGRPPKLSRPDQLLLTLMMYWREYRTKFHIGLTYGISEATVCRTIQKIENALITSEQFHLPGRKGLQPSGMKLEIVLVDVTEQPVERPQKNSEGTTAARKNATRKKLKCLSRKLQYRNDPVCRFLRREKT